MLLNLGGIKMLEKLLFIWDSRYNNPAIAVEKIPESKITLEQTRRSYGFEQDQVTGSRMYFVPTVF